MLGCAISAAAAYFLLSKILTSTVVCRREDFAAAATRTVLSQAQPIGRRICGIQVCHLNPDASGDDVGVGAQRR